jgi:hypothetical protein
MSLSCPHCSQSLPFGQTALTPHEKERLPLGNQYTKWNVIRWRSVKGAAEYFDVQDWTAKVDPELSYDENLALMMRSGVNPNRPHKQTLRKQRQE